MSGTSFPSCRSTRPPTSLRDFAAQRSASSGPSGDELIRSLENVAHVAIGTFSLAVLHLRRAEGHRSERLVQHGLSHRRGRAALGHVQFLIAVPKESAEHKQPFPVAYYGHGYTSSMVEVLGFAGNLAQQGIARSG